MEQSLAQILSQYKLTQFQPFCETVIKAFDGHPDMEPNEQPLAQIIAFLKGCDDEDPLELRIRFKHELAQLRAFELRAYQKRNDGTLRFFNALVETYAEFSKNAPDIQTYVNIHPYPPTDILKKVIEATRA